MNFMLPANSTSGLLWANQSVCIREDVGERTERGRRGKKEERDPSTRDLRIT